MGNVNNKRNWSFCMRHWFFRLLAILGVILGVIAILTIPAILVFYYLKFHDSFMLQNFLAKLSDDPATWGTFGDYLGGTLNPIISFLALIGLLYTIHQQAQEMQATREELKQAAEQQRQQVEQQSRQSNIFFFAGSA